LFICVPGLKLDGHAYAAQAAERGASALVVERDVDTDIPKLFVKDARYAMAVIAAHLYGYPSNELKVIGVTGTNGKTTTTHLIERILTDCGFRTGLMGNNGIKFGGEIRDPEANRPGNTQESIDLQRIFRQMRDVGTEYCVMEVSSMGLHMGRVKGVDFRTALFTNLTQDHLDDHKTMENYKAAKGLFFSRLGNAFYADASANKFAVLNIDDPASDYYQALTSAQVISYGIEGDADIKATDVSITAQGTRFTVTAFNQTTDIQLKMVGKFNVYNALGAIAATLAEGIPLESIKKSLEGMQGVAGRVEIVDEGQDFLVLVDYAHTPDGLINVLSTIREFVEGRVITVFGCGGDRDRTKRPIMGNVAAQYSDYLYVTSDNPRSEDPQTILQDIVPGIKEQGWTEDRYETIVDRKKAIQSAIEKASPKDVVLIAGKGHETYQIIKGVNHSFDDRLVAREALRSMRK
jgi:UDP-N-acetylmuramoyl-L-alanyl-D-glutamate--2,6-diaminopimelate ligase